MEELTIKTLEKDSPKREPIKTRVPISHPNEDKLDRSVDIKTLIVSPMPIRKLVVGEVANIVDIANLKQNNIDTILWNEKEIQFILKDGNTEITFKPELHPCTEMFFNKQEKYDNVSMFDGKGTGRIWEGEYSPIQFTKGNLLKFLTKYAHFFDKGIEKAIKNMRLTKKRIEKTEMIDLADDHTKTVVEKEKSTNVPQEFTATLPFFENFNGILNFEVVVTKKKNEYGRKENKPTLELRVTNAREVIKDVMKNVLALFPDNIPKYYGKTELNVNKSGSRY
jgi:hypothetical protein